MKLSLLSLSAVVALTALLTPGSQALPAASNRVANFNNHRVVRIDIKDDATLKTLTSNEDALAFDYFTHHKVVGDYVDIHISSENFEKFKALNIQYTTLIEDLQTVINKEQQEDKSYQATFSAKLAESKKLNGGVSKVLENGLTVPAGADVYASDVWFQGYHSFADHQNWLATQISSNPGKASSITAGKSFQGREQNGIKIGTGPNHIVFHGTQHAREWITTMVVEYLIDQLLKGTDSRVAGYLQKYTFHIIPVMNPDGFVVTQTSNRMHRKNAQTNGGCLGTDPNRNWGYQWGTGGSSSNPCAEDYKGPSAFSTPEATNVAKYIKALPKVVSYIDFHSYSQLWMTPYGYTGVRPPTYPYMSGLAAKAVAALRVKFGTSYRYGDIYNTIYPASGSSVDYALSIGVGAPFAVELRDTGASGFNLPANQILPSGQETWDAFTAILDNIQV